MGLLLKLTFCLTAALANLATGSPVDEQSVAKRAAPPTCPKSVARKSCITDAMSIDITDRWAEIFNLRIGGSKLQELVNCTTAPDIFTYDKTFTFGKGGNGELYNSRVQLYHQENAAYEARAKDPIQEGLYSTVYHAHNCDTITWRWMFNGTTSGIANPPAATNTVKGKPVVYYGTDFIFLQNESMLIKHVVTSGDWYNMFMAVGMSFQGTPLCPDPNSM